MTNSKAFTLIETLIVVGILIFMLTGVFSINIGGLLRVAETQSLKDFIVNTNNEVKLYNYTSTTIGQDIITDTLSTNSEVSRFSGNRTASNSNSKLSYYYSIYYTTSPTDNIYTESNTSSNGSFYLLQYRQEDFGGGIPFDIKYDTSPQLLQGYGGTIWSKKYKFPAFRTYYLNKIVDSTQECSSGANFSRGYIRYSSADISYRFYDKDGNQVTGANYKFCFSQYPDSYEEETGVEVNVNRSTLEEYFFESLNSY